MQRFCFCSVLLTLLTGCGGGSSNNQNLNTATPIVPPPAASIDWYQPSVLVSWQWQLQGNINTTYAVEIYDIDLFDTTDLLIQQLQVSNTKIICYFSGGSYEEWRIDANQFPTATLGNTLDGWEGEHWLDIRSDAVRNIILARLDLAKQKGCDGVEPDNMDGYTNNSGFNLSAADQLDFNRFIATESHARGLSVGLKNDLDQILDLVDYFDFVVNEQCFEYSECDLLAPFINRGKPVLNAEYKQNYVNDANARQALCNDSTARQFSSLILPLDLDDSFRLSCF